MKKEYKELLLKDLSARLPYGVEIELMPITRGKCVTLTTIILQDYFISDDVNYLPYLRPMSSMTEEEFNEYEIANEMDTAESSKSIRKNLKGEKYISSWYHGVDWLNANHFDYRGLIEKGLALEAPEGMYK